MLRAMWERKRKTLCFVAVTRETWMGVASALAIVPSKGWSAIFPGLQPDESGRKIVGPTAKGLDPF